MKNRKWIRILLSLVLDTVLATELSLLLDAAGVFFELRMTPVIFACIWVAALAVVLLCRKLTNGRKVQIAVAVPAAVLLIGIVFFGIWNTFQKTARYADVDTGKEKLYAHRSVMVIVPHQDDEYNILGGVIEEFVEYGSTVRVVYVTNGDGDGVSAEERYRDAINYCTSVGVPEENAIFLGYGDQWADPAPDIYNAQPDAVLTSYFGAAETFGASFHPAYREGVPYTLNNLCADMKSVIQEYMPDLIFCIDYDRHIGHMSTTLIFDKIMGQLLRENPGYQSVVMKGFAYGTAWFAQNDFFRLNILSTPNLFGAPYYQDPAVYDWEARIRFPVDAAILSRSVLNSGGYESMKKFASQPAASDYAPAIINADKVFWQRRTDSLCTAAEITVSSGQGVLLNDFMLIDNRDLKNQHDPFDSVWIPESGDTEKMISVKLPEATDLHSIVLYDHPSEYENVRNAVIVFADGTEISTGALHSTGAATEIPVQKTDVTGFTVMLETVEGERAGLTEIEAYAAPNQGDFSYIKMMDANGDFSYDYCFDGCETAEFSLYLYGNVPAAGSGAYTVTSDNESIAADMADGKIVVTCPVREEGVITVSCEEAGVSDSIYVRNPGGVKVFFTKLGQRIENFGRFHYQQLMAFRIVQRVGMVFGMKI